jgi:signal transduction histidine kinase
MINNNLPAADFNDILSSVITCVPFGLIAFDLSGDIIIANYLAKQYLDLPYEVDNLPNKNILDCVAEIPAIEEVLRNCLNKGRKPFNLESIPVNGKQISFKGRLIFDGFVVTVENITQLKEMEADSLFAMIEGQELERKRLAKDIHDGLGPALSIIKLNLEAVLAEIEESHQTTTIKNLRTAVELIDSMAGEIRSISHSLMPRVLEDFGLVDALESLCNSLDNTNKIKVSFLNVGVNERFDKLVELGIYRITQELLNNALKHSKAQTIQVQIISRSDSLVLMVEDDGIGFNIQEVDDEDEGIGLLNIESRAKAMGGSFYLDTAEGHGVIATIEIPLNADIYPSEE